LALIAATALSTGMLDDAVDSYGRAADIYAERRDWTACPMLRGKAMALASSGAMTKPLAVPAPTSS